MRLTAVFEPRLMSCMLLLICVSGVTFSAPPKPRPPSTVCVNNVCTNAAPAPMASNGPIKWHPGHYVWVSGRGFSSKAQAATYSFLDSIGDDPNIAGIQIIFAWGDLEGDSPGDYSSGFALVDAVLAKLASMPTPKRLMISVQERTFGQATGTAPDGYYPKYVANMDTGIVAAAANTQGGATLQSIARLDNPAVIDRLIALSKAYGARYNSNALVEMFAPMSESAVSSSASLDTATYYKQIQRLYQAIAPSWPNTLLRWQLNYAPSDDTMVSLLNAARSIPQSVIGGPDPEVPLPLPADYPANVRTIQANRIFRGLAMSGTSVSKNYEDLRNKLPWVGEYQGGSRIGAGSVLPEDFGDYEINVMHASHVIYIYNTWLPNGSAPTDPHRWAAQRAYIDSTHGLTYPGVIPPGT